jgi:hydroxyacylglutathione hydrolase
MFLSQLRHYQRSLTSLAYNKMRVIPIPCLSDNYAYLLIDPSTKLAAAIDPVEYDRVLNAVKEHGCQLTTVLTTHHH